MTAAFFNEDETKLEESASIPAGGYYAFLQKGAAKPMMAIVKVDEAGARCWAKTRNSDWMAKTYLSGVSCDDSVDPKYTVSCERTFKAPNNKIWQVTFEFKDAQ